MTVHVLRIAAATGLVMFLSLLPFLPGDYDPLAMPLSAMARVFGFTGLLLVPIGLLWAAAPGWSARLRSVLSAATLAGAVVVLGAVWLAALALGSMSLGLITLAIAVIALVRIKKRVTLLTTGAPEMTRAAALYLVMVPLAVFALDWMLIPRAVEFSRDRAMRHAGALIADIERYRTERGQYPLSILALWKDYYPDIRGVEKYHYEVQGDAYNLIFEQPAAELSTRELVVYNPRDEQVATSHASDLLKYSPDQLKQSRGYFTAHEASEPHWKYFQFD